MAQLMEYAEYLSKEIGPRPAGTEEERQAALYITERLQKDSGFSAQIEDFTSTSNIGIIGALPGIVIIIAAILGMVFPILTIPAFILAAASAALYSLEAFGRPIVTRALARGASQNVVAKYQPNFDKAVSGRSRKIVLVAHYDSGKVTPPLVRAVESTKLPVPIGLVCVCGMVLAAFFMLLHVFLNVGIGAIIINALTILALIICLYTVLRAILYQVAPYNEGANNNATGTAALIEVARRISRGSVSEADLAVSPDAYGVSIHGEEAARESGLVPEGAQIRYEAERLVPPSELGEYDEEERLLAAKAAIAALTGEPVERRTYGSVASQLVNSRAHGEDPSLQVTEQPQVAVATGVENLQSNDASANAPAIAVQPTVVDAAKDESVATPAPFESRQQPVVAPAQSDVDGYKNAPSWFVAAQQNAKKPTGEAEPVQRSRYAEAIEAAEREAAEREREEQERIRLQAEQKAREQAARAVAEQKAREEAARAQAEQAAREEAARATAAESLMPMADEKPPVFVPYEEAHADAMKPGVPVDEGRSADGPEYDDFAESLGKTAAFDPRQLQMGNPELQDEAGLERNRQDRGLANLPLVDTVPSDGEGSQGEGGAPVPENTNPSRSGLFRKLRVDVPSMSGVIRMQQAGEDVSQPPIQQPAPVQPVAGTEEPVAPARPRHASAAVDYDMRLDEIDERADYGESRSDMHEENRGDHGAVDMPETRTDGFLKKFRHGKEEDLGETPQEWLDVDDDFDARTVGRERGGWESFRNDGEDEEPQGSRRWEGGAYSRVRLGRVDTRSSEDADEVDHDDAAMAEDDRQIADEIEQIYHFRNPLYNTEVWFVALGSENMSHDGTKAFLAEHADELRGSMIIQVESLGLGELAFATAEGRVKRILSSSRNKRYANAATAATGIAPGNVDLTGSDSAASIMQAAGYQTMHLLGVENGQPALKGSPDDILENVDDLLLDDNVNFLMELLKK